MSLVHEALQKAEREKQRKAAAAPSATVATPVAPLGQAKPIYAPHSVEPLPPVARESVTAKPAPAGKAPRRPNQFLLPVLIGCVTIVATIAIVFLVSNATSTLRQSKEVSPAPATVVSTPAAKLPEPPPPPAQRATQVSAESSAPSVPPPVTPPANDSKYKLSGIMKDPDGKYVAVLNGRVAYEGYYIDGATLKKIDQDHATIEVNGREQVLRLF
jgi:hypothetical protein